METLLTFIDQIPASILSFLTSFLDSLGAWI